MFWTKTAITVIWVPIVKKGSILCLLEPDLEKADIRNTDSRRVVDY